jgi:hypothetical protein
MYRVHINMLFEMLLIANTILAFPTSPNLHASAQRTTRANNWANGRCSFHATVTQWCTWDNDKDWYHLTGITIPSILDDDYNPISCSGIIGNRRLPWTITHHDTLYVTFPGKTAPALLVRYWNWRDKQGSTHDKIRYEFEGCKWDEETTVKGEMDGCGADCTRGAWTLPELACDVARSHALQRVGVLPRLSVHV